MKEFIKLEHTQLDDENENKEKEKLKKLLLNKYYEHSVLILNK